MTGAIGMHDPVLAVMLGVGQASQGRATACNAMKILSSIMAYRAS